VAKKDGSLGIPFPLFPHIADELSIRQTGPASSLDRGDGPLTVQWRFIRKMLHGREHLHHIATYFHDAGAATQFLPRAHATVPVPADPPPARLPCPDHQGWTVQCGGLDARGSDVAHFDVRGWRPFH
jgi:hypothetical protein